MNIPVVYIHAGMCVLYIQALGKLRVDVQELAVDCGGTQVLWASYRGPLCQGTWGISEEWPPWRGGGGGGGGGGGLHSTPC